MDRMDEDNILTPRLLDQIREWDRIIALTSVPEVKHACRHMRHQAVKALLAVRDAHNRYVLEDLDYIS